MSLLNEMLKDLNENKSRTSSSPSYIPRQRKTLLEKLPHFIPWLFGTVILSLLIVLIAHGIPDKKHKTKEVLKPPQIIEQQQVQVKRSAPLSASPTTLINSASSFIPNTEIYLSYVLPVPVFPKKQTYYDELNLPAEEIPREEASIAQNEVNKVFSRLTPKEWRDEQLNKALDAIEQGNNSAAIRILDFLLFKFPHSVEARESLAAIYISQNATKEAMRVIEEGLYLIPNSVTLNTMKARLLFEQDQVEEALAILDQYKPNIYKEPDFYGLRAAVLQTVGRASEAGGIYKVLVEIEPSNGQYWLGLGITLENKHQAQQAVVAYKKAVECLDIEPSVRAYAESRLKILQG